MGPGRRRGGLVQRQPGFLTALPIGVSFYLAGPGCLARPADAGPSASKPAHARCSWRVNVAVPGIENGGERCCNGAAVSGPVSPAAWLPPMLPRWPEQHCSALKPMRF